MNTTSVHAMLLALLLCHSSQASRDPSAVHDGPRRTEPVALGDPTDLDLTHLNGAIPALRRCKSVRVEVIHYMVGLRVVSADGERRIASYLRRRLPEADLNADSGHADATVTVSIHLHDATRSLVTYRVIALIEFAAGAPSEGAFAAVYTSTNGDILGEFLRRLDRENP
jgi:hypothetical protein